MRPLFRRLSRFPLLLCVGLTGCGEVLFVEMEVPEVCKTFLDQPVEAAPVAIEGTAQLSNEYALGEGLPDLNFNNADFEARVLSVAVTARNGEENFAFAKSAQVKIDPPADSSLAPVEMNYVIHPDDASKPTLSLTTSTPNMVPYVKGGKLKFTTSITGSMPTHPWTMDVKVCVYLKTHVRYTDSTK